MSAALKRSTKSVCSSRAVRARILSFPNKSVEDPGNVISKPLVELDGAAVRFGNRQRQHGEIAAMQLLLIRGEQGFADSLPAVFGQNANLRDVSDILLDA